MNEGLNGWYGLVMILFVAGLFATILGFLGFAAMRLMLKDDVYYPNEDR